MGLCWSISRYRRRLDFVLRRAASAGCCGAVGHDRWSAVLACAKLARAGFAHCVCRLLGVQFRGRTPGHSGSAAGVRPGAQSLLGRLGEIEHLRDSLLAVEVARGAAEEEARAARDTAADTQARAFGVFYS